MKKFAISAKEFVVGTAKGAMLSEVAGYIVGKTKTFIIEPAKDYVIVPAKDYIVNSFKAFTPGFERTELWKSYQEYLEKNPASITTFYIINTALNSNVTGGGKRFDTELGNESMLQVLRMSKGFIVNTLCLSVEKEFRDVTLIVENMPGIAHTNRGGYGSPEIHLSAQYVESVAPGDKAALFYEITGILIHESTHVWQNNNNGRYSRDPVFSGVIEGIADFIRLRSGFPAKHWVRKAGGTWYSGYQTTAYFFDWIDKTKAPGFVNQLNFMMARSWNVSFVQEITGMSVENLWWAYQASI